MDLFDALTSSHARLRAAIAAALTDGWTNPSPCEGWTVRDVAQHIVGGAVRYRLLLEGAGEDLLAPTRTQDQLGDDPLASHDEKVAALMAAARRADLSAPVQHPSGSRTGTQLLHLRVMEATVHAWDIATGAGHEPGLDARLCAFVVEHFGDMGSVEGFFAPPPGPVDDDPLLALLSRTGRFASA